MVLRLDEKRERLVKMKMAEQRAMWSFSRSTYDAPRASQAETYVTADIHPSIAHMREYGYFDPGRNQVEGPRVERSVGAQPPMEPSLWNNYDFDVVVFVDHLFYFHRNLPSNYQMLSTMSPTQLSSPTSEILFRQKK